MRPTNGWSSATGCRRNERRRVTIMRTGIDMPSAQLRFQARAQYPRPEREIPAPAPEPPPEAPPEVPAAPPETIPEQVPEIPAAPDEVPPPVGPEVEARGTPIATGIVLSPTCWSQPASCHQTQCDFA